jgi:hypothetical protein
MPNHRTPTLLAAHRVALALLSSAAGPALALGLASEAPPAVLGSPLDVAIAIRVDAGETLDAACVRAQVRIGERQLPSDALRTSLSGLGVGGAGPATATLRVMSLVRVHEPVVELVVQAGCPSALSRRYVIFADPPAVAPPGAAVDAVVADATDVGATPGPAAVATRVPAPPSTTGAQASDPPARRPARSGSTGSAAPQPQSGARPAAVGARANRPVAVRPNAPAAATRPRLRLDPAPAVAAQPALRMPPGADPAAVVLSPAALALVDQANEAVKAAIVELRNAQARMAALEAQVAALNARVAEERAVAVRVQAEAAQRRRWIAPLALAFAALLGLAAWLGWRLRSLKRERHADWHAVARAAAPGPAPAVPAWTSARAPAGAGTRAPAVVRTAEAGRATTAAPAARSVRGAGLAPAHQPTPSEWGDLEASAPASGVPVAAGGSAGTDAVAAPRRPDKRTGPDVSTEELIDLEQQAEFFIALGQDEAAVDLLMAHVRDSGGASPLPYLKLLDIYRRLGRDDDYRRTQDRFNRRFNAHAPAWEGRDQTGRGLDGYPAVMTELQRVWHRPLDAMAELEALLFRRDGAAVFDLEAYRDLLLLYGVARECQESAPLSGGASGKVDVLLPLDIEMDSIFQPSGMAGADTTASATTGPSDRPRDGGP